MKKEWEAPDYNMTLIAPDMDELFSPNNWSISKKGLDFSLYTHNFANAILIEIEWKDLDPHISNDCHYLIFE